MHCSIMSEKQVSADECASALHALEGSLFGVCANRLSAGWPSEQRKRQTELTASLMSRSVLASTEGAIAELTFVLLLCRRRSLAW